MLMPASSSGLAKPILSRPIINGARVAGASATVVSAAGTSSAARTRPAQAIAAHAATKARPFLRNIAAPSLKGSQKGVVARYGRVMPATGGCPSVGQYRAGVKQNRETHFHSKP